MIWIIWDQFERYTFISLACQIILGIFCLSKTAHQEIVMFIYFSVFVFKAAAICGIIEINREN